MQEKQARYSPTGKKPATLIFLEVGFEVQRVHRDLDPPVG
jgi:hypothetical protein